jgi:hypothetical protein
MILLLFEWCETLKVVIFQRRPTFLLLLLKYGQKNAEIENWLSPTLAIF